MMLSTRSISERRSRELSRLEQQLKLLSEGVTRLDPKTEESQGDFPEKRQIDMIDAHIRGTSDLVSRFAADVERFSDDIALGNIDSRLDASKYSGVYAKMCLSLNAAYDSISKPLAQAVRVCKRISVNDYTETMSSDCKGGMAAFSDGLNAALERLTAVQSLALKISKGDISDLQTYRSIGRRSDNDKLVPAFTSMMEAIQALIDETSRLSRAAVDGELDVRGDVSKFHGEYVTIIGGINKTLDAVSEPITAVTDVMSRMSEGAVHISITNTYKGQYKVLVDAVDLLLSRLSQIISEVSSILGKIAEGDLRIDTVRDYRGDYAPISSALKTILMSLNNTMIDIHEVAAQVALGATQSADSSQMLSQGAEEQASSVEEISATVSELTKNIAQNAEYAKDARGASAKVIDVAQKGNDHMNELVAAMGEINDASTNISKIIKVIESIASQTNILALNAAVEAARAGTVGKGFAVVAGEVKSLAQKSAAAANETTALIASSIEKIKTGAAIAGDTAADFKNIYDGIVSTSAVVDKIAAASCEQAIAVSQINQAISQVTSVIQTNSATAEESAASSEELSGQAATLKSKVDSFKLREAKSGAAGYLSPDIMNEVMRILNDPRFAQGGIAVDGATPEKSAVVAGKAARNSRRDMISLSGSDFGKY